MVAEWEARDPIATYAARLVEDFGFAAEEVERIDAEVRAYVAECAERALASPMPEPGSALEGVFADRWEPLGDGVAPWSGWAETTVDRRAA
jgi:pyruvate dehydrogenase E1 component alpha subunit